MVTPPFQTLIRIPELMTNVLDFMEDVNLFGSFSTKQLEYFWRYLPENRRKIIFENMFFHNVDFHRTAMFDYRMIQTIPQLITFFHFFHLNWKNLIKPYVIRNKNFQWELIHLSRDIDGRIDGKKTKFTLTIHTTPLIKKKEEMKKYLNHHVQVFLIGVIRKRIQEYESFDFDNQILLLSFIRSILPMIGEKSNELYRTRLNGKLSFSLLLRSIITGLGGFVSNIHFDRNHFNYIVDLINFFLSDQKCSQHPIDYYPFIFPIHYSTIKSYLKEYIRRDGESEFIGKVCKKIQSVNAMNDEYSQLLWNHGCRCANHLNIVTHLISNRELQRPDRMTHQEAFAFEKKVSKLCQKITDTGLTPVVPAIYRQMFMAGCRCRNHTSSPIQ
jgi:hypothetical protein